MSAAERFGTLIERLVFGARNLIDSWKDRRIGREVAREREAVVEDENRITSYNVCYTKLLRGKQLNGTTYPRGFCHPGRYSLRQRGALQALRRRRQRPVVLPLGTSSPGILHGQHARGG